MRFRDRCLNCGDVAGTINCICPWCLRMIIITSLINGFVGWVFTKF